MKLSKIAGALLAASILAGSASTAMAKEGGTWTIDYRHDFRDYYGENYDRIAVIGAFDNGVGFYVDSSFKSWKSGKDNAPKGKYYTDGQWGDFSSNAFEGSLWWTYKFANTGFAITPGVIVEATSDVIAYKPYLRAQYNTPFGLWAALRPRVDFASTAAKSGFNNETGEAWATSSDHTVNGRIDAWLGYNYGKLSTNVNYTHMWALDDDYAGNPRHMHNKKKQNWEVNWAVSYTIDQWRPYVEIGNIGAPGSNENTKRQTRLRVGVAYTF